MDSKHILHADESQSEGTAVQTAWAGPTGLCWVEEPQPVGGTYLGQAALSRDGFLALSLSSVCGENK